MAQQAHVPVGVRPVGVLRAERAPGRASPRATTPLPNKGTPKSRPSSTSGPLSCTTTPFVKRASSAWPAWRAPSWGSSSWPGQPLHLPAFGEVWPTRPRSWPARTCPPLFTPCSTATRAPSPKPAITVSDRTEVFRSGPRPRCRTEKGDRARRRPVVLRRNLSEAFVNLGRRTQNLVTRQLEYISDIELKEADPESLEELFRLDHLATASAQRRVPAHPGRERAC